jgi:acetyltransferase EpsM
MTAEDLILIGGGRHAVETFFLLEDLGLAERVKAFVQDKVDAGSTLMGKPIISTDKMLSEYAESTRSKLLGAIGNIPDNKRLIETFKKAGYKFFNAISTSVSLDRQKFMGQGVTIAAGTILTTNITLGDHAIINIGCNISHDVSIGRYVNISPGTNIAGNVTIDDEVFIGAGVTIIPNISIGKGSIIAAAACVTKDVPPYSLVAGVPAVIKKQLKK